MGSFSQIFTDISKVVYITMPFGVVNFQAFSYGGGGCGGSANASNFGAGAGGGAGGCGGFLASNMSPGTIIAISVGAGGTSSGVNDGTNSTATMVYPYESLCVGGFGKGVPGYSQISGGTGGVGGGTITYKGGDGCTLRSAQGGGGGGAAGSTGDGVTSLSNIGGAGGPGNPGGGTGGNGRTGSQGPGLPGVTYGGGGGGSLYSSGDPKIGGNGANGCVVITYDYADNVLLNVISSFI